MPAILVRFSYVSPVYVYVCLPPDYLRSLNSPSSVFQAQIRKSRIPVLNLLGLSVLEDGDSKQHQKVCNYLPRDTVSYLSRHELLSQL
jgi:hypothetical protein